MKLQLRLVPFAPTVFGVLIGAFIAACSDSPAAPVPSVSGVVTVSATHLPVAGAIVATGGISATTGSDGRYELSGLVEGPAKLHVTATGFEDFDTDVTVTSGTTTQPIALKRLELFQFGDFAVYVPAVVSKVRGVLVTFGGPDTRAFASGGVFGAPVPQVEASLQTLGEQLRTLAMNNGLAIIGTSQAALANSATSDGTIQQAIQQAGMLSGRDDLKTAPFLIYGLSGGGPEASGFAARNAAKVAGVFLKAPLSVELLSSGPALNIPTYIIQEELDVFVNNDSLTTAFRANRAAGAPWAIALERGVPHHSLSPAQRDLTINWMSTILSMRLGANPGDAIRSINESSGWVGDAAKSLVAPWSGYSGNARAASWLPSQTTAEDWQKFIKLGSS